MLDSILISITLPNADTTFGEIQRIVGSLGEAGSLVNETKERLRAMHHSLGENFQKQRRATYQYLEHVGDVAAKLRTAFGSTKSEELKEALAAVNDLFAERNSVNALTEELMKEYDTSDQEASYIYRQR